MAKKQSFIYLVVFYSSIQKELKEGKLVANSDTLAIKKSHEYFMNIREIKKVVNSQLVITIKKYEKNEANINI